GNDFNVVRIAEDISWHQATATWNDFGPSANDGIAQTSETDGVAVIANGDQGVSQVDVTHIVQAWAHGLENTGFALFPGGSNGADIDSSESAYSANRPTL